MTDEELDSMTLRQVRELADRLRDAVKVLTEARGLLGGGEVAPRAPRVPPGHSSTGFAAAPVSAEPYPCPDCGRVAPERPGEAVGPAECPRCGNHRPALGAIMTSKGPVMLPSMDPAERARRDAERAAMMATPAFDANGEPLA